MCVCVCVRVRVCVCVCVCVHSLPAGLTPSQPSRQVQRKVLLSVALEHDLTPLLMACAQQWMSGGGGRQIDRLVPRPCPAPGP